MKGGATKTGTEGKGKTEKYERKRQRREKDAKRLHAFLSFTPLLNPAFTLLILALITPPSSPALPTSLLLSLFYSFFCYSESTKPLGTDLPHGVSCIRTFIVSFNAKVKKLNRFTYGTNHRWESAEGAVLIIKLNNSLAANRSAQFIKCSDHKFEVFLITGDG